MAITEQERLQIVDEVVNKIKDESQGVNELPEVTSLSGIKSLPAMKGTEMVVAPISLLGADATTAAAEARTAAQKANIAATNATRVIEESKPVIEEARTLNNSFTTFDGVFNSSSGIDSTRDFLNTGITIPEGKVCLETSNERFILCFAENETDFKSCDYMTEWPGSDLYNDSNGKARADKVFRCGSSLYGREAGSERMSRFANEYSIYKSIDAVEDKLSGLTDTVSEQSRLLAALARGELVMLLERLGYDADDIDEFMFANVQLNAGITIDDVRMSAERFELFKENKIETPFECPVVPRYWKAPSHSNDLEDLTTDDPTQDGIRFLKNFTQGKVKYLPRIKGDDPMWFESNFSIYEFVRYIGGVEYDTPPSKRSGGCDFSILPGLLGVGAFINSGCGVGFCDSWQLQYIGHIVVERANNLFEDVHNLYDFSGLEITGSPRIFYKLNPVTDTYGKGATKPTLLPDSLRYIEDNDDWAMSFDGHYFKETTLNVPNLAGLNECTFEDCSVTVRDPYWEPGRPIYIKEHSRFVVCAERVWLNKFFVSPRQTINTTAGTLNCYVEIEAPEFRETVGTLNSKIQLFLFGVGQNPKCNYIDMYQCSVVKEPLPDGEPHTIDPRWLEVFHRSLDSFYDRNLLGDEQEYCEIIFYEGSDAAAALDDEHIAALNQKGYSVLIV